MFYLGISTGLGRESRASAANGGPRASSGNISAKILDKRFNKILLNMHGIPVKADGASKRHGVRSSSQEDQGQYSHPNQVTHGLHPRRKGNRKNKPDVVEQHV